MASKNKRKGRIVSIPPERGRPEFVQPIFGMNPVLEALRSGKRRIERILVLEGAREARLHEILYLARKKKIPFESVTINQIAAAAGGAESHQGIVAIAGKGEYFPAEELVDDLRDDALAVVLDGIEDPRNFGAILRTAECAGADGVFIPERRAAGITETVVKTSAGATEFVKVSRVKNVARLIDRLKEKGIWVVGSAGDAEKEYSEWDWKQPSALVLGNEGKGLRRLVREKCDILVSIPMFGEIASLNVSVAAGVILFEARRQRRAIGNPNETD